MTVKYPRADPVLLAKFNPYTKDCTMNCSGGMGDPRSVKERLFLCNDCLPNKIASDAIWECDACGRYYNSKSDAHSCCGWQVTECREPTSTELEVAGQMRLAL